MSGRKKYHGPSVFKGKAQDDPNVRPAWFTEHIESIPDIGRHLLEEYSGIPSDEVLSHLIAVRDKAFNIWSYGCIGQVRFLVFTLPKLPYWAQVLSRLRSGATFIDAGCCFGQEIRFLVFNERIPSTQLYGFDLELAFIDFGYVLFRDRDKLHATMVSGDVFADASALEGKNLTTLEGKMDIVPAASLFRSWGWDDMIIATKRLVSLTRKQPRSMIIGN